MAWRQRRRRQWQRGKACLRTSKAGVGQVPTTPPPSSQYIDTGSVKPLFDVCTYGFVFSYAFSWPREYAHYKHEQEAKLKGGHH